MAQTDFGPGGQSPSAVLTCGSVASIEFHAPNGANSLAPIDAPNVDIGAATSAAASPLNAKIFVGGKMQIPA